MTDPLDALYRSTARETPTAAADAAVFRAAAAQVERRRRAPLLALAAVLVVAVLVMQSREAVRPAITPGASPEATRAYLMNLQTPQDAGPAEGNG